MDIRPAFVDLSQPNDLLNLKNLLSEMGDELDILYTTTAPNGNISARQGRLALYNNSGTYSIWKNTTGSTTWVQLLDSSHVNTSTGHDHDGSDSKKVLATNLDLTGITASHYVYNNAGTLAGKDIMNTSSGHDHDGSDSKKVVGTNLDMTGITSGHFLYNNAGTLAGKDLSFKYENQTNPSATQTSTNLTVAPGKTYILVIRLLIGDSDSELKLRFNDDSGTSYGYARSGYSNSATVGDSAGTTDGILLHTVKANKYFYGIFQFMTFSGNDEDAHIIGHISYEDSAGNWATLNVSGWYDGNKDLESVEIYGSQTFSGDLYLYSLATS